MIQDFINQYEYDTDYEFDFNSVDDIKDDRVKNEIKSIYKSIELYKEQKNIMDNQFKIYNQQGKEVILQKIFYIFVININLNALVMIGK